MTQRVNKYRRHGARYKARRRAVDLLFEAESRDHDPVALLEERVELSQNRELGIAPIAEYTREIVTGAARELDVIDDTIIAHLDPEWELERLPAVDRAILRMAIWELLFNPDVPTATALVEAVELASEYSTNKAAPYIHATLDGVGKKREELAAQAAAQPESVEPGAEQAEEASAATAEAESAESEPAETVADAGGADALQADTATAQPAGPQGEEPETAPPAHEDQGVDAGVTSDAEDHNPAE